MAKKRITQGANLRTFGKDNGVCSYVVGESELHPGQGHITQYSSELVGPLTAAQLRELAANLLACADALDGGES